MERGHIYRFEGFSLDPARTCLTRDGEAIPLRPKAFDMLLFLVEHRGRVASKDELVQAVWPRTIVTDDSLTKCIKDVRQALGDEGRRCIKTVSRRGYLFDAEVDVIEQAADSDNPNWPAPLTDALGEPAAGPQAGSSSTTADGSRAAAGRRPGRRTVSARLIAAGVLLACAVSVAVWYGAGTHTAAEKSVAVLPFENMSPEPDHAFFAAGIHESILNQLSAIEGMQAVARTTMLRYAGTIEPLREIARELKVEAVVEGSVRYADGRVLVTAQLIDPESGMHLWSEEYNRPFDDIFEVQTDIARRVALSLDAELSESPSAQVPTESPEAYALYLRGRYFWNSWALGDLRRSVDYFEQAIRVDPGFALAHAGLADAYSALAGNGAGAPRELMPKARDAAARALAIDPELPEAHIAMGLVMHFYDYDFAGGDMHFERALALAPESVTALHLYGKLLLDSLRFQDSEAYLSRALEREPYSVSILKDIAETYYYSRRYEDAVAWFERALELEGSYAPAHFWLVQCHAQLGQFAKAIEHHRVLSGSVTSTAVSGSGSSRRAREEWTAVLEQAVERMRESQNRGDYVEPFYLVQAYVHLHRADEAFLYLQRALELRSTFVATVPYDPLFEPLHDDPRFVAFISQAGLNQYYSSEHGVQRIEEE